MLDCVNGAFIGHLLVRIVRTNHIRRRRETGGRDIGCIILARGRVAATTLYAYPLLHPPCHHGGDRAHSSSLKHQQTNEREKDHNTTKEQAWIIVNNICLFFEPIHGSKPFKSIAAGNLKPGDALDTIALKRKFEQMASMENRMNISGNKYSSVQSQHGSMFLQRNI